MQLLLFCLVVGAVLLVLALITWGLSLLFGKRKVGRSVFRFYAIAYVVLLPILVFVGIPLFFSYMLAHSGTRPPDQRLERTPEDLGCVYQDVTFPSRDGTRLSGWYLPAEGRRPALSISHGLFRNRHELLDRGCAFNRRGFPVLLFDFRGHTSKQGGSELRGISLGYQERLDVQGAVDYLASRGHEEIVLLGVSMGAVAVIEAAPEVVRHLVAIVADSPFASLDKTLDRHVRLFLGLPAFPFSEVFAWNLRRLTGTPAGQPNSVDSLGQVGNTPVLLIYGEEDSRMPEETAREVYQAIQSPEKKLVLFPEAGHGDAYEQDPERYLETVEDFLASRVPAVEAP